MKDPKSNGPDKMCASFNHSGIKLSVSLLDRETILIESDKEGLRFLGQLLNEVASGEDEGFHISPYGPGSSHFSQKSKLGLYIHRIDK